MRFKRVRLSSEFFLQMFTVGNETNCICVEGLPQGARFMYITSGQIAGIDLVIAHESFPPLKDGDEIPIYESIVMNKIYK